MNIYTVIVSLTKCFKNAYYNLMHELNKQATVTVDGMKFYTPSQLCAWRAKTIFLKEPQTIKWIDSFADDEIFWDIGANVGVYSMYSGVKRQLKTLAFEPSPFNFGVLSKNIYLNKQSDKISAFCLAFSDQTVIDYLNLKSVDAGAAHTSFKNNTNEFGIVFAPEYSHVTMGFRIDDFIKMYDIEVPNHIKIDVDGAEKLVIDGAAETLRMPQVKSILIELNTKLSGKEKEVFEYIQNCGFYLERSDHPDNDVRLSNYIFRRI